MTSLKAGILYLYKNRVLLLRNQKGIWTLPGDYISSGQTPSFTAQQAARQAVGYDWSGQSLWSLGIRNNEIISRVFAIRLEHAPPPYLDEAYTQSGWFSTEDLPSPLGFIARMAVKRLSMTQDEIARFMAEGYFTSPLWFLNSCLFAMRISGTNFAIREGPEGQGRELTFRDPALWTSKRMLEAANGLPVIMQHPETQSLTDRSFAERIAGTIILPFKRNDELWGIARILNRPLAEVLAHTQWSTSPGVITGRKTEKSLHQNGGIFIDKTMPFLLDHLAICEQGVWDKGQSPSGIETNTGLYGVPHMDDELEPGQITDKADESVSDHHNNNPDMTIFLERIPELKSLLANFLENPKADHNETDLTELSRKLLTTLSILGKDVQKTKTSSEEREPAMAEVTALEEAERLKQLNDEIELLRQRTKPLSDEENNEISEITAKADAVAIATGTTTPRHIAGETPMAFRRRLARQFLQFSKNQRGVDLSTLSDGNFEIAERQIYADAITYQPAQSSLNPTDPMIRKTMTDPITGQRITRYQGSPRAAFAPFLAAPLGS